MSSVGVGRTEDVYDCQWSCVEEASEADEESASKYSSTVYHQCLLVCSLLLFICPLLTVITTST